VIFSTDLFTLPRTKLLDAEVATTIFDGKVVYSRQLEPAGASITQ
jgi:predicted amidohydrolase YtcJ